jgi:biopolymer transport protein ExbD
MMFRRPRRPTHTIDMAPLIDVVFLLLVFFMLTSSFSPPSVPLKLPELRATEAVEPPVVVISLDAGGGITIGADEVDETQFVSRLRVALGEAATATVHFRGDREADYGRFLKLMARAKEAGATQFHLVHDPSAE